MCLKLCREGGQGKHDVQQIVCKKETDMWGRDDFVFLLFMVGRVAVCIYIYVQKSIYKYVYTCTYIYVYIHICIYIHIYNISASEYVYTIFRQIVSYKYIWDE